jgi:hypothetical protein
MAMEITEMVYDQGGPKKPKKIEKPAGPKGKLLSSMKKKFINGVEVMDTELRQNVPVKQVKKETQEFVNAMDGARKRMEREVAEKEKVKPAIGGPKLSGNNLAPNLPQSKMYGPSKAPKNYGLINKAPAKSKMK